MTTLRLVLQRSAAPVLRTRGGGAALYAGGVITLLIAVAAATAVGTTTIPLRDTIGILVDALPGVHIAGGWSDAQETILLQIRLPRVLAAALVGAALSVAGAIFQGVFRNPLVDPYIIGVSSGAAFAAVVGFVVVPQVGFFFFGFSWVPFLAFVGALATVVVVYWLAQSDGRAPITTLLLVGIAVGALLTAAMAFLMLTQADSQLRLASIFSWLLGGIGTVGWGQFALLAPFIGGGLLLARAFAYPLNLLALGEEHAGVLGLRVETTKATLIATSALMTAAAVAAGGLIGFVGLVIPHSMRLLVGPDHRRLLWASALFGAIFLVLMDLAARTVLSPHEVPVGVLTGIVGGPFFLLLLRRAKGRYDF